MDEVAQPLVALLALSPDDLDDFEDITIDFEQKKVRWHEACPSLSEEQEVRPAERSQERPSERWCPASATW